LKQQALLDRPSPAISHPHYPIVSNVHNVNKSTDSLFINSASSAEKPIVSSKPKHIADVAQNKDDVKPKVPSRPIRPKRPQSMFISKSGSTSLDSKQVENNGTGSDLKRIISNLAATDKLSTSPKGNNHIDSNLEFLKNLEQQNSGKSWVQQTTGGSIRSISRLNTGSKRINSLISSFTGKFSRPSSASSSRASSIHENFGIRSENTGTSIKFRSSSESIEEETFDTPKGPPVLKKSNSIQRRVKQLMNRSYDPPIIKTAKGYGNDALKETKHRKGSIDSDGFTKPSIKIKPVAPAPSTSKPKAVPSTPPLSSQSTPNTVTKTPKQKIRELASPQSTLKKKVPPPKPKKPEHLRTIESSPRHDDKKKPLKQVASNNTSSQYLKVSNDGGLVKVHSLDSEISDFDEWEKKFHEKYPKAL
jgi:AP2-associated kinase